MGLTTCIDTGLHLTDCDEDGYCNICGYQDEFGVTTGAWDMNVKLIAGGEANPLSDKDFAAISDVVHDCLEKGDWNEFDTLLEKLSIKYGKKETPGMTSIYVVMEAGLEYNDEIYYQQGWENLGNTAFLTVEAARENAKIRLKSLIGGFNLTAFTYDYDEDFTASVKGWAATIDTDYDCTTWNQYINWAEANGVEWITEVPEFVVIREIKVPGQVTPLH